MDAFFELVYQIKLMLSSEVFVAFVLLCAVYFCIRMMFPQFRFFGKACKALFDSSDSKDGISPFQAFATALGSRVGVGNIAGIASAISVGGPGAIFWIWIFGIFGSGLAVAESIVGQIYKIKEGDEFLGGPAYYIRHMFGGGKFAKILAAIYAVLGVVCITAFMVGVQSNTVVDTIINGFNVDKNITIIVTAILIAVIIWGGIKRIGAIEGVLTPVKLFAYFFFAFAVIVWNYEYIGTCFYSIFSSAWGFNPIFGAIMGQAIAMGVRRGIFSTDVGYGAGAAFSAVARTDHPVKQALLQGLSVLISTLIICTLSALIILSDGAFTVNDTAINDVTLYAGVNYTGTAAGATWVQAALNDVPILHGWGPQALAVLIAIFAAGTIIGYYYLAENNLRYLLGKPNKKAVTILKVGFLICLVASTLVSADAIWDFADIGLALLCWINLICMLIMSPKIARVIKDYAKDIRAGKLSKFDPGRYGFEDKTGAWDVEVN